MSTVDPSSIRLVTGRSPHRLEDALVRRVREAVADGGSGLLVVVPTRLAAERVQRALLLGAEEDGVAAGVDVVHHHALAGTLLERAFLLEARDAPPPRVLSPLELEELVRRCALALPEGRSIRRLVEERPRTCSALARTLGELREADVQPDGLSAGPEAGDDGLAELHASLVAALERLEGESGSTDYAGHAAAAARAARSLGERSELPWTQAFHHGSYELVGVHAELLAVVAAFVPFTVLAPGGDGPCFERARQGLARWPGRDGVVEDLDASHSSPLPLDLDALFAEDATPREAGLHVEAFHCRGTRAEVDVAARLAAEAHLERGVALEDIAIVARTLAPHAGHVEHVLQAHGLPFTATAGVPATREPWMQAALALLECLTEGFPRSVLAELLRSPFIRIPSFVDAEFVAPDLWDTWTREAGLVRGAQSIRDGLMAWHYSDLNDRRVRSGDSFDPDAEWIGRRCARIDALLMVVDVLAHGGREWSACRTHSEHATFLKTLAGEWLRDPLAGPQGASARFARDAFHGVLDQIARLDGLGVEGESPTPKRVRELVLRGVRARALPSGTEDRSGVRVLDVMQARGLPFEEVVAIGFNQGVLPRRTRQDPFLPDAERLQARERSGKPLAAKSEGVDEERLLLAVMLGSARTRLSVTWQRADDEGKARAPSIYLRELARLALGRPDLDALVARRNDADADERLPLTAVPAHPAHSARLLRERWGRTPLRDGATELSDRRSRRNDVAALAAATGRDGDDLAAGLAKLGIVDAFSLERLPDREAALAHDAMLGPGAVRVPRSPSATSLEDLGRCALRWLFRHAWRIGELEEPEDDLEPGAREVGSLVHDVLEAVHLRSIERGGTAEALRSVVEEGLLEDTWRRRFEQRFGARRGLAPLYWDGLSARWLEAVRDFTERDAERLEENDARVHAVETSMRGDVSLPESDGEERSWRVRGRVDRILRTKNGWRVEDYKSSRKVSKHVKPIEVLRGQRLQGFAYGFAADAWARDQEESGPLDHIDVAFLAIHPDVEEHDAAVLDRAGLEHGGLETVAVLEGLLREGRFPFKPGRHCDWCEHVASCRRHHVPTLERLTDLPEVGDYRDVSEKKQASPDLASVRKARAEKEQRDA